MTTTELSQAVKMSLLPPLQSLWAGPNARPAWAHAKARYAAEFTRGEYWLNDDKVFQDQAISVSRSSEAVARRNNGTYATFPANALARTDRGADFQGQFTNKIRNPRGEGGVVGTVGVLNKTTGYNAAPPALVPMGTAAAFNSAVTNMTANGGDGSTLFGVVDDTAALQAIAASDPFIAAGLANGWLNGRVFKIDNSAGGVNAVVTSGGVTGNTNGHACSTYGRGVMTMGISGGSTSANINSAGYVRTSAVGTPTSSARSFFALVGAGNVAYFILFDLIEASTAAPVPTVVAGASATGALPMNWSISANTTGLDLCYLGSGNNGYGPRARVRVIGTATSTNSIRVQGEENTQVAAAPGQAWGLDYWIAKVAGVLPASTMTARLDFRGAGGAGADVYDGADAIPTSSVPVRSLVTGVATNVGIQNIRPTFKFGSVVSGVTYDYTVDLFAPKLVQVAVIEGPALVTNGDFASGTGWTLPAGFSITGGKLVLSSPAAYTSASFAVSPQPASSSLKTVFSITDYVAGTAKIGGGGTVGSARGSVATFTEYLATATPMTTATIQASAASSDLSIDNFSVKLVTPGYLPTYPVLPPVGVIADSTRYADNVQAIQALRNDGLTNQPFAGWEAAGFDNGFTVLGVINYSHNGDGATRTAIEIRLDATHRVFFGTNSGNGLQLFVLNGATSANLVSGETSGITPFALTVKDGAYVLAVKGRTTVTSAVTGALSAGLTTMYLGSIAGGLPLNDIIQQLQITAPLTQAEAEAWVAEA